MANYIFEFTRVDNFLDDMNRDGKFDIYDMDGLTKNYKMVLVSDCPTDIEKCIDEDGTLLGDDIVHRIESLGVDDGMCSLLYSHGVNGERTISISDSVVSYDLGDNQEQLKAVFIVNMVDGSGYVIAYAINNYSFPVSGEVILPCDGMIWSIRYG